MVVLTASDPGKPWSNAATAAAAHSAHDAEGEGPQAPDADGMDPFEREEGQRDEQDEHGEGERRRRRKDEAVKRDDIPQGGKADEKSVLGFALIVAEMVERGEEDQRPR